VPQTAGYQHIRIGMHPSLYEINNNLAADNIVEFVHWTSGCHVAFAGAQRTDEGTVAVVVTNLGTTFAKEASLSGGSMGCYWVRFQAYILANSQG
jgi:hypothetical protein